jgi:hypothetical protein
MSSREANVHIEPMIDYAITRQKSPGSNTEILVIARPKIEGATFTF